MKKACWYTVLLLTLLFVLGGGLAESQAQKRIMTIGDSNGAFEDGWVAQLQKLVPEDIFYNTSVPGNTIGFDNLGQTRLNTLKNIRQYLSAAQDSLKQIDYVIIMLGTNDSKYVFRDRTDEVIENMQKLITFIKNFNYTSGKNPEIILVAPPPFGDDKILEPKYQGGNKRVRALVSKYRQLATKNNCDFVNEYKQFRKTFMQYSRDGVHLNSEGQIKIAGKIAKELD
ncbi:MAG: hypothetical protein KDC69_09045 [Flavobacteriaceae bacterium]|nr:hypothetical protein [Flavobacteriaceae bacterium]